MIHGVVKWFNELAGYGFITVDKAPDVFVHIKDLRKTGIKVLRTGDLVEFKTKPGERSEVAYSVHITRAVDRESRSQLGKAASLVLLLLLFALPAWAQTNFVQVQFNLVNFTGETEPRTLIITPDDDGITVDGTGTNIAVSGAITRTVTNSVIVPLLPFNYHYSFAKIPGKIALQVYPTNTVVNAITLSTGYKIYTYTNLYGVVAKIVSGSTNVVISPVDGSGIVTISVAQPAPVDPTQFDAAGMAQSWSQSTSNGLQVQITANTAATTTSSNALQAQINTKDINGAALAAQLAAAADASAKDLVQSNSFQTQVNTKIGTNDPRYLASLTNASAFVSYVSAPHDGITDATAVIQSAITNLEAHGGGELHLPAGTYLLTSTLRINNTNVWINGAGKATRLLAASDYGDILYFALPADPVDAPGLIGCRVSNLTIDSLVQRTSGAAIHARFTREFCVDHVDLGEFESGHNTDSIRLWDGIRLEAQDKCLVDSVNGTCLNTAIYVDGAYVSPLAVVSSAMFNYDGWVSHCELWGSCENTRTGTGILVGGRMGGFRVTDSSVAGFATGFRSQCAADGTKNREIFLSTSFFDSCSGNGIEIATGSCDIFQDTEVWASGCTGCGIYFETNAVLDHFNLIGGSAYRNFGGDINIGASTAPGYLDSVFCYLIRVTNSNCSLFGLGPQTQVLGTYINPLLVTSLTNVLFYSTITNTGSLTNFNLQSTILLGTSNGATNSHDSSIDAQVAGAYVETASGSMEWDRMDIANASGDPLFRISVDETHLLIKLYRVDYDPAGDTDVETDLLFFPYQLSNFPAVVNLSGAWSENEQMNYLSNSPTPTNNAATATLATNSINATNLVGKITGSQVSSIVTNATYAQSATNLIGSITGSQVTSAVTNSINAQQATHATNADTLSAVLPMSLGGTGTTNSPVAGSLLSSQGGDTNSMWTQNLLWTNGVLQVRGTNGNTVTIDSNGGLVKQTIGGQTNFFGQVTATYGTNSTTWNNGEFHIHTPVWFTNQSSTTTVASVVLPANALGSNGTLTINCLWYGNINTNAYLNYSVYLNGLVVAISYFNPSTAMPIFNGRTVDWIENMSNPKSQMGNSFNGFGAWGAAPIAPQSASADTTAAVLVQIVCYSNRYSTNSLQSCDFIIHTQNY